MLKSFFVLMMGVCQYPADKVMPFYPAYIAALFLILTAGLLLCAIRAGLKALRKGPMPGLTLNIIFVAGLVLFIWLRHQSFILFTDEKMYLQQALDYVRTGQSGLLLSDSIMPLFFGMTLKYGNLTILKAILFLFLAVHFLLWKLILQEVLKVGAVLSAIAVFLCAIFCMSCQPNIISYMTFGYLLSSSFAYLALRQLPERSGGNIPYSLPFIALLAVLFRQECVVLFPLLFLPLLFSGAGKTRLLPALLAGVLALPVLYSSWWDELRMNTEKFDRDFVSGCYDSGLHDCYKPGLSANKSYMLNTLDGLSKQENVRGDRIIELAQELYDAPSPSLMNAYYHLKYRQRWLLIMTGAAFISMLLGLVFLKSLRQPLGFLACMTIAYFALFYLQKYSVGWFERFYFYLFPLYCCFFLVWLEPALKKYWPPVFAGVPGTKRP